MKSFNNIKGMFLGVIYSHVMLLVTAIAYDVIHWGYVDVDDLIEYIKVFGVIFVIAMTTLYAGNILVKGIKGDIADLKIRSKAKKTA